MISPLEMRVLDRNAQPFGVSILDLMENAGKAVAEVARNEFSAAGKHVLVLCGTGNNGGDGLVAARHLAKDARVTVLLARSPDQFDTKEAQTNFERLRDAQILAGLDRSEEAIAEADLIIDALLGIGAQGSLRGPFASLLRQVNASGKPVISVDVPSGFGTELMVRPTVTVALHDAKEGMTPENSGRIRIVDIGIPSKVVTMIGPGEFLLYPIPKASSHKGENGRLLVIAGGPYTGAPALVAFGAFGVGIDLAHIATPALAATVVAGYSPTFIVHPLVGHRLLCEDPRGDCAPERSGRHRVGWSPAEVQLHRESGHDDRRDGRRPVRTDRGTDREGHDAVRCGAARRVHERGGRRPRVRGQELWPHVRRRGEQPRTGPREVPLIARARCGSSKSHSY